MCKSADMFGRRSDKSLKWNNAFNRDNSSFKIREFNFIGCGWIYQTLKVASVLSLLQQSSIQYSNCANRRFSFSSLLPVLVWSLWSCSPSIECVRLLSSPAMSASSSSRVGVGGGFASSKDFRLAYASDKSLGEGADDEYVQSAMKKTKEIGTAPVQCFRKPITASGRVPLKGTAGKKLRSALVGLFQKTTATDDDWERLWPKKANVVSEKITGAAMAEVEHKPMVYWIRAEEGDDKNDLGSPMFVDFSGGHGDAHMVWPTICALAIVPGLLRPMYVHPGVSSYIVSGADVMWPGVISEPEADAGVGRFQRGERRALVAQGNPVPFAVGWLSSDSATVIAAHRTGKALSIVHSYLDELWKLGDGRPPNVGFQKGRVYAIRQVGQEAGVESEDDEDAAGEQEVRQATNVLAGVQISDGVNVPESWDNGAAPPIAAATDASASTDKPSSETADEATALPADETAAAAAQEGDDDAAGDDADADASEVATVDGELLSGDDDDDASSSSRARLSPSEMDGALLQAFLYAVHLRLQDSDFPMDPSTLLSHMEACHFESERLDPRRSTYKKMSKCVRDFQKRGLLKAKTGGGAQGMCNTDLVVMSVNRASTLVQDLQVTKDFADAVKRKEKDRQKKHAKSATAASSASAAASSSSSASATAASASASSSGGSNTTGKMQIRHLYRMGPRLLRFLFAPDALNDPKRLWTMTDAKAVLQEYIAEKELDVGQGKVRMDAMLFQTFFDPGEKGAGTEKAPSGVERNTWTSFLREYAQRPVSARFPDVLKSDLSNRFDGLVIEYYAIVPPGGDQPDPAEYRKGPLPTIEVRTEKRQGGKLLTGVAGLEVFGVDPLVFAKEAAKVFACSCSTQTIPANAKHKAYEEVFIQGNVAAEMGAKLQAMYGIPAQCVKAKKK